VPFLFETFLIYSLIFFIALVTREDNERMADSAALEKRIAKALTSRGSKRIGDKDAVPAAVLLLLFKFEKVHHILFTKRSDKVACHKGEVSFPGGTVDPEDEDFLHTALREGYEEIGLRPTDVTILGRLDDMSTVTTGFVITPYVGVIPHPYPFDINTDEIAELIFLPLHMLEDLFCGKAQGNPGGKGRVSGPCFHYEGNIIWGATARILKQFMDLVCGLKA
jgi:8-oxo-dGTP pyrophosphatase MutT (NUDIX family)